MSLKFRLKGLAETFIDTLTCPDCEHDGGDDGDDGFLTDLTRVTFDGIVVVVQCEVCNHIFVPDGQRHGIVNLERLRNAVERDSINTGQPIFENAEAVRLDVEKMNSFLSHKIQ